VVCASKSWSICNACKNLRGQHPQRPKCSVSQNVRLSWSIWAPITFLFVDQSSRNFFRQTWKGLWLIKYFFLFAICRCVPEIFAIEVESCQKALWILDVFFALPNFRGQAFQKLYARYHPCLATRRLEKFYEDIPTSPEVIGVHTLNFKPNFKFSRLELF